MVEYSLIPSADSGGCSSAPPPTLKQALVAEVLGTYVLVQVGCGGLCACLYMGVFSGSWETAVIWLLGAMVAVYCVGDISGAHLNPAVSLSFALVRDDLDMKKVPLYWAAQLLGGMLAGAINLVLFTAAIADFEEKQGLMRGRAESIQSAAAFGGYWSLSSGVAGPFHAVFIEAFGTAFVTFVIFAITHPKNEAVSSSAVAPLIGTAMGVMVAVLGSLTGAGINPARDLGPRIVTSVAGWGGVAFTNFGAYIVGPFIGGPIGAFVADYILFMD